MEYAFKDITCSGRTAVPVRGQDTSMVVTQEKAAAYTCIDKPIDASYVTHLRSITPTSGRVKTGLKDDPCGIGVPRSNESSRSNWIMGRVPMIPLVLAGDLAMGELLPTSRVMMLKAVEQRRRRSMQKLRRPYYFVGFHATAVRQKQQEAINFLEKQGRKLGCGEGTKDLAGASEALSHDEVIEVREAMSTVHASDYKPEEVEIGIVSTSEGEHPKTEGLGRVERVAEIEHHLLAVTTGVRVYSEFTHLIIYRGQQYQCNEAHCS
ncbi:putative 20S proteasome subunit [Pisolithus sp. B1]|nr:putative 20S proteasome subunit [Pisolithus sp. B1]